LIVQAKSGTGKTCVFAVIALEHILASNSRALQVVILAPTREIAVQIHDVIKVLSVHTKIKSGVFIGGLSVKSDKEKLKSCQIAIGSPGIGLLLDKK
jgi:ATP-dependent RNA helicase DDX20